MRYPINSNILYTKKESKVIACIVVWNRQLVTFRLSKLYYINYIFYILLEGRSLLTFLCIGAIFIGK